MAERQTEATRLNLAGAGEIHAYRSYDDPNADFAVVFVHGLGSTLRGEKAQALEAACGRRGWTFAGFDFRGHGQSSGSLRELKGSALLEDVEALQVHLADKGIRRLFLVGSSMGGWASAWFAVRHPRAVPACVLVAPALDFIRHRWSRLSEEERHAWKRSGVHRLQNEWLDIELGYSLIEEADHFPIERLAADWSTPALLIHGMVDESIPYAHSLTFVERCTYPDLELRLLRFGDHRLNQWKEEMAEAACEFFRRKGCL